ncbi:PAS domain S-box protein [Salipaludibacillus daqingensis]|uniref:PAS domain S-box protein n=1 Tax=Salipaludibacillus daqingensis TaxID=3041001 RepID=UPI002473E87B|nr:PAS domain S-box protein [Salipaludibacillus daqingensis]
MTTDKTNQRANDICSILSKEQTKDSLIDSFSSTMDLLSDGVLFLNLNWEFEYINQSAEKLLRHDREKLLGKQIWQEYPHLVKTLFYEAYHHAHLKNDVMEFDEYDPAFDSWFHVKAYPKKNGLLIIFQDITEKHVAMEVVEESYRTLFQKHPDAVCSIDLDGNFLALNTAFKTLFPTDEKLFLGSHYLEFIPDELKERVKNIFNYAKNGKPQTTELNFTKEFKRPFHLFLTALPIIVQSNIIGVYGILKDITAERDSLEKYLEVSQMNELILNSVEDGIVGFDGHQNVIMWNRAAEKMTGYKKEELNLDIVNRIFKEVNSPLWTTDSTNNDEHGLDEKIIRVSDVSIFRKDGQPIIIEYVMTPIAGINKVVGKVYTFRDITEKKKSDELLYQSEKLSAVGQLAAGIAHEIRNPLTSLKGFLQLIEMSGEGKKEYFEIMKSEFGRIEQILNELLVLSKPQSINKEVCSMNSLLDHIITLLNTQAIIKNIYIEKYEYTEQAKVYCTSSQIKQVFINFIKNAIEAMDSGKIIVNLWEENDFAIIEIIDEGCGIPESLLSKVGEPFFTTKEKGTGLGLMVSYQIIEDHGGDIQVCSKEGEGTRFTVKLPIYSKD